MTQSRFVYLCALIALGASPAAGRPAAPLPALDSLIQFEDPANCRPAPATAELIGMLVHSNLDTLSENWITPGTVPEALRDRFGPITVQRADGMVHVHTAVRGALWGLPLTGITHEIPEGGDPGGVTFTFAAPVAVVERAARARGLVARAGQDVAMGPPDALVHTIGLHADEYGGAALSCGYHS